MDIIEMPLLARFFNQNEIGQPYPDAGHLLDDLLRFVDLLCVAYSEINHNEDTPYSNRGLVITEEQFYEALFSTALYKTVEPPLPDALSAAEQIRSRVHATELGGTTPALVSLCRRFKLDEFESFCLLLSCCVDLDRKYERIFGFLQNDITVSRPTLGLAMSLFSLLREVNTTEVYALLDRQRPLNAVLLQDWSEASGKSVLARPMAVQKRVLFELMDIPSPYVDDLAHFCHTLEGDGETLLLREDLIASGSRFIARALSEERLPGAPARVLYLHGAVGVGKTFVLNQIAKQTQSAFCVVDMERLREEPSSALAGLLGMVTVQCLLDGTLPCLDHIHFDTPNLYNLTVAAVAHLSRWFPILALCADAPWRFDRDLDAEYLPLELLPPTSVQRQQLWAHFVKEQNCPLHNVEPSELASRYQITPKQIRHLVQNLKQNSGLAGEQTGTLQQIAQAIRESTENKLGDIAHRLPAPFVWSDLQVPEDSEFLLRRAADRIRHSYQVNDCWGFRKKLPYGRGLSILLYGPPGTGKTMAAQVLANEIGLDLFRVDLSQVMDKYIGETEKKLGKLFAVAENANCVLFFDEADALFSKRTDVSDSKDKYANVETSYLLQRIEQYSGISILATNSVRNFDEAFRRRVTYYINIPMPDQATRRKIWETVFPAELPIAPSVRFDELAEHFELSGSSIKSVAVSAAYEAAALGTEVTRRCIFEALRLEYLKNGRILNPSEYHC